jgi:hypothetical protein
MTTAAEIISNNVIRLSEILKQMAALGKERDAIESEMAQCLRMLQGSTPPKITVKEDRKALAKRIMLRFDLASYEVLATAMALEMPEGDNNKRDQRKSNARRDIKHLVDSGFLVEDSFGYLRYCG